MKFSACLVQLVISFDLLAGTLNYLSAALSITFGVIYLFKRSFLQYHQDAVRRTWYQLESGLQILILALMRAVSGGALLLGFVIITLQRQFDRSHASWIPTTILISACILSLCSLYAMWLVRSRTNGRPPAFAIIISLVLVLIAYLLNSGSVIPYSGM